MQNRAAYFIVALAFISVNALVLVYRYLPLEANAQTILCKTPPHHEQGIRYTRPQGKHVSVTIDSFWTGQKKDAVEQAFHNWENNSVANCSQVKNPRRKRTGLSSGLPEQV